MKYKKILFRVFFYIMGLFILAFGVVLSINSDLGVSPVNALPYVLSFVMNVDMGTCVVAVFSVFILVQIVILRKDFKWINLTQIIFSSLFGYFVDFAKSILGGFALPTYAGKLSMLIMSILSVAIGIVVYVNTKLVNMPMEGMTAAFAEKLAGKSFHQIKAILDCTVVLAAMLLSFFSVGKVHGVREGTVLCALLVGPLMKPIQKILKPIIDSICFEN
jgi:uncharacterized membrane protein YczE